jgi:hypothetical protein
VIALSFLRQLFAIAIKVQGVICYLKIERFGRHILYLLNTWVAKLEYFAAILTDKVVVLCKFVRPFEMGNVLSELVLGDQFAFKKQLNRVVQCGSTDAIVLVLHLNV